MSGPLDLRTLEGPAEAQGNQRAGPQHILQALVEIGAEEDLLKTRWPRYQSLQALVKSIPKGQGFKAHWPNKTFQALIKLTSKGQVLKIVGEFDPLHPLIEIVAKLQAAQAGRQVDIHKALVEAIAQRQVQQAWSSQTLQVSVETPAGIGRTLSCLAWHSRNAAGRWEGMSSYME